MADGIGIGPVCADEHCLVEGEHRHDTRDGSIWRLTAQATGRLEKTGDHSFRVVPIPGG